MSGLHDQLGKRAFELLLASEQDFWKSEQENIPEYCFYPDLHLGEQWGSPEKLKYYEKYCLMPNNRCISHGPTGSDWQGASFAGELSVEPLDYTLRYYCPLIVELLRKEDRTESARFAGTLAHLVQDYCIPVHSMNNITLNQLYPPADGRYYFWHRIFDKIPFDPEKIHGEPELLGYDLDSLIYLLRERCFRVMERNIAAIPAFIQAVSADDTRKLKVISQQINEVAVLLTVSLWHTLFTIARGEVSLADRAEFGKYPLSSLPLILSTEQKFNRQQFIDAGIPFYQTIYQETDPCRSRLSVDPYPFEPAVGYVCDGKGNTVEPALQINGQRCQDRNAVAVGTFGVASFRVDGRIFSGLEVYAGVHCDSEFDGEVICAVWCHEADKPLMAQGKISRNQDALHFNIELPPGCQTISLLSVGGNGRSTTVWLKPELTFR